METAEFIGRLSSLSGADIVAVAARLRADAEVSGGEVTWWRATMAVTACLRRRHLSRQAGLAAHRAAEAVMSAARDADVPDQARDDVTVVARAAGEAARALFAARHGPLPPG
ncbi:MAG: hypothetical protein ACRD0U_08525, partial [Acidimicrobiales bacterium]